jgi:hypothetical protein
VVLLRERSVSLSAANHVPSRIEIADYSPKTRFERGRSPFHTDLEQVASVVNSLPEFIRFTGLNLHRVVTNAADWERYEVAHRWVAFGHG